ncbi:MAG: holo-ACP synthase [bacterium]|nr:holo-ACP synthase [bacterium]
MKSIGIDIVEIERIAADIERFGDRFIKRVLSERERELYENRSDKELFLAGRFAAKEAVIKALGHYLTDRPPLNRLEILNSKSGQPELVLSDYLSGQLSGATCLISISHEKHYATAVAAFVEER